MNPDYILIDSRDEVQEYFQAYPNHNYIAVDTETWGGHPWSVQWSLKKCTGRMILAKSINALHELGLYLHDQQIILHNAPGDLDTLEKMGIIPGCFRDTMQELYQQGSLPQGLKVAAYRLLGAEMRSWIDVVWPASVGAVSSWMEDALSLAETGLQDVEVTYLKIALCRGCGKRGKAETCVVCGEKREFVRTEYKPGAAQQVLRHVLNHTALTAEDDKPYDPWKALARFKAEGLRGKRAEDWEWAHLEQELGPMPILGIGNADLRDAVEYGCGDADQTGQVAAELVRLRGDKRWEIPQEDWDR